MEISAQDLGVEPSDKHSGTFLHKPAGRAGAVVVAGCVAGGRDFCKGAVLQKRSCKSSACSALRVPFPLADQFSEIYLRYLESRLIIYLHDYDAKNASLSLT